MNQIEKIKRKGNIPRAVIYARFSSENQRDESIDAQLRAAREFCMQNGIIIVNEYCDRAKSATTDNRPEFLQMISDAKKRNFDLVIVHKFDRFARNRYDSAKYRQLLEYENVQIISVLEQFDDKPESVLTLSVLEGMAEFYSKNLSREVMKGLKENALKCWFTGGTVLFGYSVDQETRKFVVNAAEAEIVRTIYSMIVNGYGYTDVLRHLKNIGAKTRRGNDFSKSTVYDLLRNEKYTGIYIYNRASSKKLDGTRNNHQSKNIDEQIRIEGGMPQIITPEEFKKVQAILDNRKKGTRAGIKRDYALAGYVFCGQCGHRCSGSVMQSGHTKRTPVGIYSCNNRDNRVDVCKNKTIHQAPLEALVQQIIADIIFDESRIPEIVEAYREFVARQSIDDRDSIRIMKENAKKVGQKITNIVNVIANTGSPALMSELQKLEDEKRDIEQRIRKAEESAAEDSIDIDAVISAYREAKKMLLDGDPELQKQLYHQYLDRVIVYPDYVEIYVKNIPDKLIKRHIEFDEDSHGHTNNNEQAENQNPENCFGTGARTTEMQKNTEPDHWSDSADDGGA